MMNSHQTRARKIAGRAGLSELAASFVALLILHEPDVCGPGGRLKSNVRDAFAALGWDRLDVREAMRHCHQAGVLHYSDSGAAVSFHVFGQPKGARFCAYCRCRESKSNRLTRDHVIPRAQGGSNKQANIVLACRTCNELKGNQTPEQWAAKILDFRKPVKPMTRLPFRYRIRLAVSAAVSFIAAFVGTSS